MIKGTDLEMQRLAWIIQVRPLFSHESWSGEPFLAVLGRGDTDRRTRPTVAGFAGGGKGAANQAMGAKQCGGLEKLGTALVDGKERGLGLNHKEMDFPLEPPARTQPCLHLDFSLL